MNQNLHFVKRKSILLYFLINIVTCGLFYYFLVYQLADELSNENPERKTINPIGLMFITIIPIAGPIIWILQITSRMKYTGQKYALPISLKTGLIKTLYIIGAIGAPILLIIGFVLSFIYATNNKASDVILILSIACLFIAFVGGICMFIAIILLFVEYNKLADALIYVPGANMSQIDMFNQPINNQFVQQPMQSQQQTETVVITQSTDNNQPQDNL